MNSKRFDGLRHGFAALALGHTLQLIAFIAFRTFEGPAAPLPTSFFIMIAFGLTQLVYVAPLLISALVTRRFRPALALFIGAALTAFFNLAIWGFITASGNLVP